MGTGELGVCPRCGWPLEGPDELEVLRALADDLGIAVVGGTVSSTDAARLLGLSEKTCETCEAKCAAPNTSSAAVGCATRSRI